MSDKEQQLFHWRQEREQQRISKLRQELEDPRTTKSDKERRLAQLKQLEQRRANMRPPTMKAMAVQQNAHGRPTSSDRQSKIPSPSRTSAYHSAPRRRPSPAHKRTNELPPPPPPVEKQTQRRPRFDEFKRLQRSRRVEKPPRLVASEVGKSVHGESSAEGGRLTLSDLAIDYSLHSTAKMNNQKEDQTNRSRDEEAQDLNKPKERYEENGNSNENDESPMQEWMDQEEEEEEILPEYSFESPVEHTSDSECEKVEDVEQTTEQEEEDGQEDNSNEDEEASVQEWREEVEEIPSEHSSEPRMEEMETVEDDNCSTDETSYAVDDDPLDSSDLIQENEDDDEVRQDISRALEDIEETLETSDEIVRLDALQEMMAVEAYQSWNSRWWRSACSIASAMAFGVLVIIAAIYTPFVHTSLAYIGDEAVRLYTFLSASVLTWDFPEDAVEWASTIYDTIVLSIQSIVAGLAEVDIYSTLMSCLSFVMASVQDVVVSCSLVFREVWSFMLSLLSSSLSYWHQTCQDMYDLVSMAWKKEEVDAEKVSSMVEEYWASDVAIKDLQGWYRRKTEEVRYEKQRVIDYFIFRTNTEQQEVMAAAWRDILHRPELEIKFQGGMEPLKKDTSFDNHMKENALPVVQEAAYDSKQQTSVFMHDLYIPQKVEDFATEIQLLDDMTEWLGSHIGLLAIVSVFFLSLFISLQRTWRKYKAKKRLEALDDIFDELEELDEDGLQV